MAIFYESFASKIYLSINCCTRGPLKARGPRHVPWVSWTIMAPDCALAYALGVLDYTGPLAPNKRTLGSRTGLAKQLATRCSSITVVVLVSRVWEKVYNILITLVVGGLDGVATHPPDPARPSLQSPPVASTLPWSPP